MTTVSERAAVTGYQPATWARHPKTNAWGVRTRAGTRIVHTYPPNGGAPRLATTVRTRDGRERDVTLDHRGRKYLGDNAFWHPVLT